MNAATVVINAAGCGSRLGMNIPKSLVEVAGRPILEWQLREMCQQLETVRIVVGYMREQVTELARRLRPSIEIIENNQWKVTKTAASLSLGMADVAGRCVSLDGDLLVHPADFWRIVSADHDVIGVTDTISAQPVFASVDAARACTAMSYSVISPYEWTGLVNFNPSQVAPAQNNVFEMIECLLPVPAVCVRCCEIDTPADFLNATRVWPQYVNTPERKYASRNVG